MRISDWSSDVCSSDLPIIPEGDTTIEAEDEVFFVSAAPHAPKIIAELRRLDRPVRRVMLAGGGNIGFRLAKALEDSRIQVKLIERSRERAGYLAEHLRNAVVLSGDGANDALLREENIDRKSVV